MIHGVLVIDKPSGITSHDVVNRARRIFRQRRVGHTGTLDPIATGILALLLGKATRLSRFLTAGEKHYCGVVKLGCATTTDDTEGEPLSDVRPISFSDGLLQEASRELVGPIQQIPPLYSAKKKHGEPAYTRARRDQPVEREPIDVTIYSMEVERLGDDRLQFETRCTAGTYARAIARDLGERLGCGGHLEKLTRMRSGPFHMEQARTLEQLEEMEDPRDAVIPFDEIPLPYPDVTISLEEVERVSHGMAVATAGRVEPIGGAPPDWVRLRSPAGTFVALAGLDGPFLHPRVVFPD
jgi:tRNA pseudouridine55 synthase